MSITPTEHCVSLDSAVASFSPDRSFFLSFHHSRTAEFNERILTQRFQNIIVAEAKYFDNDVGVHLSSAIDVVNHNENNVPPHFFRFAVGARSFSEISCHHRAWLTEHFLLLYFREA